ncbi:DUF397 domain-containing protein [Streptomyces sp. NPDC049577]|uniref:DUF397 domain-containing protein n=1 Tax=Streptomyces sp. NPDC049577 TaxID=3155153 RepID=UPI003414964D
MRTIPPLFRSGWHKSSHSNGEGGGGCLEWSQGGATVHIRDSKRPHRPALAFPAPAWQAFVRALASREPAPPPFRSAVPRLPARCAGSAE